jgi:protein-S-isoprenylcysteine O-methyltransferase Ste14
MLSWVGFMIATIILGAWLRRHPSQRNAEGASRILHFVFFAVPIPAAGLGVFYPGLTEFDRELGINPLPRHPLMLIIGILGVTIGIYMFILANVALRRLGEGANAFRLTKRLVVGDIYERTRNPMSLGFYLCALGIGLLVRSTYMTLATLIIVIPVHIFYLKYFEERELELRLEESYGEYKKKVPFLLPRLVSRRRPASL